MIRKFLTWLGHKKYKIVVKLPLKELNRFTPLSNEKQKDMILSWFALRGVDFSDAHTIYKDKESALIVEQEVKQ